MKAPSTPDTASDSRAIANGPSRNGIAMPAVPLALDMNDDGIEEPHELFIDAGDGSIWLHSDTRTLKTFLKRKRDKNKGQSPQIDALLTKIKVAAKIVHWNTYTRKEPAPRRESKKQRASLKIQRRFVPMTPTAWKR